MKTARRGKLRRSVLSSLMSSLQLENYIIERILAMNELSGGLQNF
jgi:hypothetical protein